MIRVVLPAHLRNLAQVHGEVTLDVPAPVTIAATIGALEEKLPVLCGRIREHGGGPRRPYVRYYACREDLSHDPVDTVLPDEVISGKEPLLVVGAMSGG